MRLRLGVNRLAELKIYYFTFGLGHLYAGHVQPIAATSPLHALQAMVFTYGKKWAFKYTEEQWDKSKKEGASEKELELLDARKVVLSDYAR